MIHAEPGPNVVQAYPVAVDGAGYAAQISPVLIGTRDKWFRPADVCVAPDGSLFVADWYDPGVGGNGMGDLDRGRVFRVAPPDTPPIRLPPIRIEEQSPRRPGLCRPPGRRRTPRTRGSGIGPSRLAFRRRRPPRRTMESALHSGHRDGLQPFRARHMQKLRYCSFETPIRTNRPSPSATNTLEHPCLVSTRTLGSSPWSLSLFYIVAMRTPPAIGRTIRPAATSSPTPTNSSLNTAYCVSRRAKMSETISASLKAAEDDYTGH